MSSPPAPSAGGSLNRHFSDTAPAARLTWGVGGTELNSEPESVGPYQQQPTPQATLAPLLMGWVYSGRQAQTRVLLAVSQPAWEGVLGLATESPAGQPEAGPAGRRQPAAPTAVSTFHTLGARQSRLNRGARHPPVAQSPSWPHGRDPSAVLLKPGCGRTHGHNLILSSLVGYAESTTSFWGLPHWGKPGLLRATAGGH